jgi:hypothetical protein
MIYPGGFEAGKLRAALTDIAEISVAYGVKGHCYRASKETH